MKKIIAISLLAVSVLFLASCEKEHAYNQKVTYYPTITLEGDETMYLELGEEYEEPGFTAIMSGKDVTDSVAVNDNLDNTTVGVYYVIYSMVNEDGFPSSTSRRLVVYDPSIEIDIAGTYSGVNETYRIYWPETRTDFPGFTAVIEKMAPGVFSIDDCFAGYYSQKMGYGESYNCNGIIAVDADNNITLLESFIAGWGDGVDNFEGSVDENGTISMYMEYANCMEFHITLKADAE